MRVDPVIPDVGVLLLSPLYSVYFSVLLAGLCCTPHGAFVFPMGSCTYPDVLVQIPNIYSCKWSNSDLNIVFIALSELSLLGPVRGGGHYWPPPGGCWGEVSHWVESLKWRSASNWRVSPTQGTNMILIQKVYLHKICFLLCSFHRMPAVVFFWQHCSIPIMFPHSPTSTAREKKQ